MSWMWGKYTPSENQCSVVFAASSEACRWFGAQTDLRVFREGIESEPLGLLISRIKGQNMSLVPVRCLHMEGIEPMAMAFFTLKHKIEHSFKVEVTKR